ncbi:phenylacetaldoxime dehydratase family protein [Marinomonas sp. ef1]|jgi:aldoxime dehydratase|uniref:phenylacetaldoxime dehydratase family protein n=1 Tax=Marinomonas sp. ef1 TaxID=2005043 RepID=UPI000C29446C|nr:phenylacetaldoxime dehydratase family protein [Marinomonas sp. ef1]
MESAIPSHLQQERRVAKNTEQGYEPLFPAWTARFDPLVDQVVMAYFGVQSKEYTDLFSLIPITSLFNTDFAPLYWDPAHYVDAQCFHNCIAIAYWRDVASFDKWRKLSGFDKWWNDPIREKETTGWFLEVVSPAADRFETLFSTLGVVEGLANLAQGMSEPIQEHAYWGSMRDRLPIAQTEELASTDTLYASQVSNRIQVKGRDNLCLIRSGQDWSETKGKERAMYTQDMQPVLIKGMDFLRDYGIEAGCISCRFMTVLDPITGQKIEKTFGLAHFDALSSLESWAKTHPTHVAIFGSFMKYAQALEFNMAIRLYHEVAVIPASAQFFEYINCHSNTGLLSN